jgi:hypothetical protein
MAPLTIEEAKTGKKFSCSCGGGGDFESRFACPQQGTCKYYAILSFTADGKRARIQQVGTLGYKMLG